MPPLNSHARSALAVTACTLRNPLPFTCQDHDVPFMTSQS